MFEISSHPFMVLPKFGTGIGLHRVCFLARFLGLDLEKSAHNALVITGSNGKGSTAKISSELLHILGLKVGLFTSPHLYRYNERFQINGVCIDDESLSLCMGRLMVAVEAYEQKHSDKVGAFEAQFVLALLWFIQHGVDVMVLEAGIGGRYDPVRTIKSSYTALVSLDLEHTELMGNTLQAIAFDKMDACYNGGEVICGVSCGKIRSDIENYAKLRGISPLFLNDYTMEIHEIIDGFQHFSIVSDELKLDNLRSHLIGKHQLNNHMVAMMLCQHWLKREGKWDIEKVQTLWPLAVMQVRWSGRLEIISESPFVCVDVGHTPDGILQALDGFKSLAVNKKSLLVTGGSANKKVDEMLHLLAPHFELIICTCAHHKGMPAEQVAVYASEANPKAHILLASSMKDAVELSYKEAAANGMGIYVAGGLFLAIEYSHAARGKDPASLRFF